MCFSHHALINPGANLITQFTSREYNNTESLISLQKCITVTLLLDSLLTIDWSQHETAGEHLASRSTLPGGSQLKMK